MPLRVIKETRKERGGCRRVKKRVEQVRREPQMVDGEYFSTWVIIFGGLVQR